MPPARNSTHRRSISPGQTPRASLARPALSDFRKTGVNQEEKALNSGPNVRRLDHSAPSRAHALANREQRRDSRDADAANTHPPSDADCAPSPNSQGPRDNPLRTPPESPRRVAEARSPPRLRQGRHNQVVPARPCSPTSKPQHPRSRTIPAFSCGIPLLAA